MMLFGMPVTVETIGFMFWTSQCLVLLSVMLLIAHPRGSEE